MTEPATEFAFTFRGASELSTITLFDDSAITEIDVVRASASCLL